jgi:hypothetical protein
VYEAIFSKVPPYLPPRLIFILTIVELNLSSGNNRCLACRGSIWSVAVKTLLYVQIYKTNSAQKSTCITTVGGYFLQSNSITPTLSNVLIEIPDTFNMFKCNYSEAGLVLESFNKSSRH